MAGQTPESRQLVIANVIQTVVLLVAILGIVLPVWSSFHDAQVKSLTKQEDTANNVAKIEKKADETAKDIQLSLESIKTAVNATTLDSRLASQTLMQHSKDIEDIKQQQMELRKHCDELNTQNIAAMQKLMDRLEKNGR